MALKFFKYPFPSTLAEPRKQFYQKHLDEINMAPDLEYIGAGLHLPPEQQLQVPFKDNYLADNLVYNLVEAIKDRYAKTLINTGGKTLYPILKYVLEARAGVQEHLATIPNIRDYFNTIYPHHKHVTDEFENLLNSSSFMDYYSQHKPVWTFLGFLDRLPPAEQENLAQRFLQFPYYYRSLMNTLETFTPGREEGSQLMSHPAYDIASQLTSIRDAADHLFHSLPPEHQANILKGVDNVDNFSNELSSLKDLLGGADTPSAKFTSEGTFHE